MIRKRRFETESIWLLYLLSCLALSFSIAVSLVFSSKFEFAEPLKYIQKGFGFDKFSFSKGKANYLTCSGAFFKASSNVGYLNEDKHFENLILILIRSNNQELLPTSCISKRGIYYSLGTCDLDYCLLQFLQNLSGLIIHNPLIFWLHLVYRDYRIKFRCIQDHILIEYLLYLRIWIFFPGLQLILK